MPIEWGCPYRPCSRVENKTLAVVGSGSVGLYYGGKLAADGHDVRFLLRSGYEEAAQEGIRIFSPKTGDDAPRPPADLSQPGRNRAGRFSDRGGQGDRQRRPAFLLSPLLHEDTALLTLQNLASAETITWESISEPDA